MESQESITEEREELMVAAGGAGEPTFRRAHFLAPTQALAAFPRSPDTGTSLSSQKVVFLGWRGPQTGWVKWFHQLEPMYGQMWKKAGIYDAILASTYEVVKNRGSKNLMLNLAEKWCPKTNTFLFPWGECSVTLEDVMVLGGFPVLGELVFRPRGSELGFRPRGSDELLRLEKKLREERLLIRRYTGQGVREGTWLDHFMGGGSEKLEHEAFLVLWLTRFVFPTPSLLIEEGLFLIAINLSRGIRIAFGPAVLASIYRDLSCLKKASHKKLILSSPLGIVQVWAWERFPRLSPILPNPLEPGEPRLARWRGVSSLVLDVSDVDQLLDSSGEDFQWRPYVRTLRNWDFKDLFCLGEGYVNVMAGSEMDSEAVQVSVRCWRSSELVGMDCVEQYLPHRVGMQLGFDQDLPGRVERVDDDDPDKAWIHYNRPVRSIRIYVPGRLRESRVTKRYLESWNMARENPAPGDVDEADVIMEEDTTEMENVCVQVQMDASDQPERMEIGPKISEAAVEAVLDQAAGNGKGSSRPYTIEEVTAMIVNLEKTWAAVKAKRREAATRK